MKNWFVAGASRGLGHAWIEAALERGDRVAAAVRDVASLDALVARHGERLLPIALDVRERPAVGQAIGTAADRFGRLDVIASNAGNALFATIEESAEAEARQQIETNFFGTLWMFQAAVPVLRAQGGGHILVTSSLAGIITFPTAGIYNATKWALEGLAETLASEVDDFGIKVTLIEPGGYDTDWRSSSATFAPQMPEYDGLRNRMKAAAGGRKLGDPRATAGAILKLVDSPQPPLRLFLGNSCLATARRAYSDRLDVWEGWSTISAAAQG